MFDFAAKYWTHLHEDRTKSEEIFKLLHCLEQYVNGAIIEMNRLEKTRKNITKKLSKMRQSLDPPRRKDFQITYLACDTHFYYICIDKCYKLIEQLSIELNENEIKKLGTKLNEVFHIATIRNDLEHIDARCMGYHNREDEKKKNKKPIRDFGNFWGDNFSFNDKKYQSNKKSLEELKNIYRDLEVVS